MIEKSNLFAVATDAELQGRDDLAKELRAQAGLLPPETPLEELLGRTLCRVTQNGVDSIDFEAVTGEQWQMFYSPDCCATCSIEDVAGDLQDLVGAPIMMAEESTNSDDPKDAEYPDDSFTWTFYKFATTKGYVTIRWYGSSNGYYSEIATFRRVEGT